MNTLLVTTQVVLPTFLLIALGYLLRLLKVIDPEGGRKMNAFAFQLLIPAMIFHNIYRAGLDSVSNWRLVLFAVVGVTALFGVVMLLVPLFEKDNARRGVIIQGISRSSFVVIGMGLVSSMYPNGDVGVMGILSAVVAPMFNGYSVIALELYRGGKPDWKRIGRNVVTNPLIVASVLAIGVMLLDIQLPTMLTDLVATLSAMATPLALIVSGVAFRFASVGERKKQVTISCLGRLVLVPLVFVPLAVGLGFRQLELLALVVLFASPNAVSSHIMAANADGDEALAGQIVVFSTCFSVVTLFGFIYTLLAMGYL